MPATITVAAAAPTTTKDVAAAAAPTETTTSAGSCRSTTAPQGVGAVGVADTATIATIATIDEAAGCGSIATLTEVGEATPVSSVTRNNNIEDDTNATHETAALVTEVAAIVPATTTTAAAVNRKLLLCRRFKDSGGILRNFNSLPLFVYATSTTTHATSADGVGVGRDAAAAVAIIGGMSNDSYELAAICTANKNGGGSNMNCLPLSSATNSTTLHPHPHHHHHPMTTTAIVSAVPTTSAAAAATSYQHHLNLNHHHQLLAHHSPYSNNYHLHHSNSHQHIHTEQTKSLQELQHEVGALLEFRDLVIETFPDLKHKMASMSSSSTTATAGAGGNSSATASVSSAITLTGNGLLSGTSMASRREWEPGIRIKRKISHKEPSTSVAASSGASGAAATAAAPAVAGEMSSSSLSRSRSNSHSGKKEPKSGENNNGSVVQDSGFSTETSSSKEGHSASSTNGAMTGPIASNRLAQPESDDELMNLLDVIHRKSNRIRDEVEQLQNYERQNLRVGENTAAAADAAQLRLLSKSGSNSSTNGSSTSSGLTPKTFREHVERLNKEDIKQLRKERDRLLDKLAEMEAETLTGRIKAAKMNDQVEELISVKKDLEEQLKLAMAQKLELSSRVQQLQQQQQQPQHSKSSSSQSDYSSSQRLNFLSSATTVLSTGSGTTPPEGGSPTFSAVAASAAGSANRSNSVAANTFQPVVVEQQDSTMTLEATKNFLAFHQSASSDSRQLQQPLGRLDGIVSTPGGRNTKCRVTDSKRFQAILLETNVIELQRHLLTLTVQNQVLAQKLDQSTKSKTHIVKRLDKSKEDVEDLKFQLEEKNIELEGTKAQLRVLESRMHSSTPSTGTSFMHSQHDYETNRSSASTTLMLSRRGGDSHFSDSRSGTPISVNSNNMLPAPTATQISTPSMKAMTHLPMDELQQHSSSTESTHDLQLELPQAISNKLMSASVGGTSPFATTQRQQHQNGKRLSLSATSASKPSKIPLPGSKAAAYFAGKPPTGRPATAGRSPPSANTSTGSHTSNSSSNKSSLSRSTGNLLYSKSPNSLKRADSAQSIRKDATSSLSTNTSRSSTSSIPMATTPYSSRTIGSHHTMMPTTPSPRVLQNSPLPKLKRDSLTSRVRHLDSLSRVYQQQQQQQHHSNDSTHSSHGASHNVGSPNNNGGSYLIASTPKTSIASQLSTTMRKDLQLNNSTSSSQQFLRRTATTGNTGGPAKTTTAATTRRFSSASAVGARIASGRTHVTHENVGAHNSSSVSNNSTSSSSTSSSAHTTSSSSEQHNAAHGADNDSGKKLAFLNNKNNYFADYNKASGGKADIIKWQKITGNPISTEKFNNKNNNSLKQHSSNGKWNKLQQDFITKLRSNQKEQEKQQQPQQQQLQQQHQFNVQPIDAVVKTLHDNQSPYVQHHHHHQYQHTDDQNHKKNNNNNNNDDYAYNRLLIDALHDTNDDDVDDYSRHSFYDYYNSMQQEKEQEEEMEGSSSNKLLVTFDYGFSDSIEHQQLSVKFKPDVDECDCHKNLTEADSNINEEDDSQVWTICNSHQTKADAAQFPVHRMRHNIKDNEMSFLSTLIEYDIDEENEEMLHYAMLAESKIKLFGQRYYDDDDNIYQKRGVRIEADDDDAEHHVVDDEEEFYDSLESATFSRFARA